MPYKIKNTKKKRKPIFCHSLQFAGGRTTSTGTEPTGLESVMHPKYRDIRPHPNFLHQQGKILDKQMLPAAVYRSLIHRAIGMSQWFALPSSEDEAATQGLQSLPAKGSRGKILMTRNRFQQTIVALINTINQLKHFCHDQEIILFIIFNFRLITADDPCRLCPIGHAEKGRRRACVYRQSQSGRQLI